MDPSDRNGCFLRGKKTWVDIALFCLVTCTFCMIQYSKEVITRCRCHALWLSNLQNYDLNKSLFINYTIWYSVRARENRLAASCLAIIPNMTLSWEQSKLSLAFRKSSTWGDTCLDEAIVLHWDPQDLRSPRIEIIVPIPVFNLDLGYCFREFPIEREWNKSQMSETKSCGKAREMFLFVRKLWEYLHREDNSRGRGSWSSLFLSYIVPKGSLND